MSPKIRCNLIRNSVPPPSNNGKNSILPPKTFKHIVLSHEIETGMEDFCGAKTINLAAMKHALDVRVPPFFVITSKVVRHILQSGGFPGGFIGELKQALVIHEQDVKAFSGKRRKQVFGEDFYVSVRAAGPQFMSGILRTLLNIGKTRIAPLKQLKTAIKEVAYSWDKVHARVYRKKAGYMEDPCHAIIVQMMIHGDKNEGSASGVYFTHSPVHGKSESGKFGIRKTGNYVMSKSGKKIPFEEYIERHPKAAGRIRRTGKILLSHFGDAQEIEATVEDGNVFYLQTRAPERSAEAALRIAINLASESLTSKRRASELVKPKHEDALMADIPDQDAIDPNKLLASGLGVAPGVGIGKLAFSTASAIKNPGSILIKEVIDPQDFPGIDLSKGFISFRDELGVHTRSLALGRCTPAIANVENMTVDLVNIRLTIKTEQGNIILTENDVISIDGKTGNIYKGAMPVKRSRIAELTEKLSRYVCELDSVPAITRPMEEEEKLARSLIRIRKWRELPKARDIKPSTVYWPKIRVRADQIPEIKDFDRSVLITAFDLLRKESFGVSAIFDAIMEQEETAKDLWGHKPYKDYDHIHLKQRGKELLMALYYLDESPAKMVCQAFFSTRTELHVDAKNAILALPAEWAVLLVDGIAEAAKHEGLRMQDYFFLLILSSLIEDKEHGNILKKIKPETLAYFLEYYYRFEKVSKRISRSTTVKREVKPEHDMVTAILREVNSALLAKAINLIENKKAKEYWQKALSMID